MPDAEHSGNDSTREALRPASAWLAALFLLALLIRLFALGQQNLWFDEHLTLRGAVLPWEKLLTHLRDVESSKPPLYFLLLHEFLWLGENEFWLRLPSAIFGAATCIVAAAMGHQLLDRRAGWVLGLLLAFSPLHVWFSQEARPYALWGFWTALAMWFVLRFCAERRPAVLAGFVLCGALSCYTFTYGIFLTAFACLFGLAFRPALPRQALWSLGGASAAMLLLYVPWLWQVATAISTSEVFQGLRRGSAVEATGYSFLALGFGQTLGPTAESLRLLGVRALREQPWETASLVVAGLALALLLVVGAVSLWKQHRNAFWFAALGLAVFWLTPSVLSVLKPGIPNNPRYALPAVLPLLVFVAATLGAGVRKTPSLWAALFLFFAGMGASLQRHFFDPRHARDDLRAAAQFTRELQPPPQRVLVTAKHLEPLFCHYFGREEMPIQGFSASNLPADYVAEQTAAFLRDSQRFALIYSREDHGDREGTLLRVLRERYHLVEQRHWTGVTVYLFEK